MIYMNPRAYNAFRCMRNIFVDKDDREDFDDAFEEFLEAYNEDEDTDADADDDEDEDALPEVGDMYIDKNGDKLTVYAIVNQNSDEPLIIATKDTTKTTTLRSILSMPVKQFCDTVVRQVN